MTAEERDGELTWWYTYPRSIRALERGGMLFILGVGAVLAAGSAYALVTSAPERDWGSVLGGALCLACGVLLCCSRVQGVALDGEDLLVRRVLPGRVERLPIGSLRAWLVVDPLMTHLWLKGPWLVPLHVGCPGWMGRARYPGWEEVVSAVRARLKPGGWWWE